MRSSYWTFIEACDETQSIRSVKDLVGVTMRGLGVDGFAIVTHGRIEDLRSLGVLLHNWPVEAVEWMFAHQLDCSPSPLFDAVEKKAGPVYWPRHNARRDAIRRPERHWFDQLRKRSGQSEGVSQALKSVIVGASCSLTSADRLDLDRVRLCMRIGNYAYQQILELQKPRLGEAEQLTAREHELLYRATIFGERPADVASQVDVKISTVRTLRQKASVRLDAGSQEQAAWRMVETGQLFRAGRKTRPRGR